VELISNDGLCFGDKVCQINATVAEVFDFERRQVKLRPVCADASISLLFNTCIISTICHSDLDVLSYFRRKAD